MTRALLLRQALQRAFPRVSFSVRQRKHPEWLLVTWSRTPEPMRPDADAVGTAAVAAGFRLWHAWALAPETGILVGWPASSASAEPSRAP